MKSIKFPQMFKISEGLEYQYRDIHSNDLDEFSGMMNPRNLYFENLGKARAFQINAKMVFSHGFELTVSNISGIVHYTGVTLADMMTSIIPMKPNQQFLWRNLEISGNSIVSYELGGEVDNLMKNDIEVSVVSIDKKVFLQRAYEIGVAPISLMERSRTGQVKLDAFSMSRIRSLINQILSLSRMKGSEKSKNSSFKIIKKQIIDFIILSTINLSKNKKEELSNRVRIFKKFNEFMKMNISAPYNSREFCKFIGSNERTLQYSIKHFTLLTPNQLAKAIKLNQVRAFLKDSDYNDLRVNQVAYEFGFWHLGQFSQDYKNKFGELPSETLKRK